MITSIGNRQLKDIRALLDRSGARRKTGLFAVEGLRMYREIPAEALKETYISETFSKEHPEIKGEIVADDVFKKLSDTQHPQGILAVAAQCSYRPEQLKGGRKYLILEAVQDPGNLGTIVRTAEAAGVSGIIMDRNTADIYSPKVVRSTMGSIFRVPYIYTDNLPGEINRLKENGIRIYAAHLQGKEIGQHVLVYPRAFMIGNEGSGLSEETAALADEKIKIPMAGKVESLNAAVSAALLMYAE